MTDWKHRRIACKQPGKTWQRC